MKSHVSNKSPYKCEMDFYIGIVQRREAIEQSQGATCAPEKEKKSKPNRRNSTKTGMKMFRRERSASSRDVHE